MLAVWAARLIEEAWVAPILSLGALAATLALLLWRAGRTQRRQTNPGPGAALHALPAPSAADDALLAPTDRILPLGTTGFLVVVALIGLALWSLGLWLTGARDRFLASPEWRFQPFYIAAHFIALRLFVSVYSRNFRRGIARLDVLPEAALGGMRRLLGLPGALAALAIATPFSVLDYGYLYSPRYAKLEQDDIVRAIDMLMWSIWSMEWLLNAFMWVILTGFLFKNSLIIARHRFLAPIEIVLQERHYRPFLQMSSQGATVLLCFSMVSVLYVAYTGGEMTDYVGLMVTVLLLSIGFLVPWLMLRAKVRRLVREETAILQRRVAGVLSDDGSQPTAPLSMWSAPGAAPELGALGRQLDLAVGLLRITQLERLNHGLGSAEARAVLVRVLAPMVTIAWQLSQNLGTILQKLIQLFPSLAHRLQGLM